MFRLATTTTAVFLLVTNTVLAKTKPAQKFLTEAIPGEFPPRFRWASWLRKTDRARTSKPSVRRRHDMVPANAEGHRSRHSSRRDAASRPQ